MRRFLMKLYYLMTAPVAIMFILDSDLIHPAYQMTAWKRLRLGLRMFHNKHRIQTGTSFKAHLVMAMKLLELPPDVAGDVVECGTWHGGSAANLSLVCEIVGRRLLVYDSFQGLPAGVSGDREAKFYKAGEYHGPLATVRENIRKFGAWDRRANPLDRVEFIEGWFDATLPNDSSPVALAFVDVDLEASLETCVRYLWPRLIQQGHLFLDECTNTDYCALFFSERYWRERFDTTPPGLIGAGSGLALGEHYVGPFSERETHPLQHATTGAYTRKDMSGVWTYFPP